MNEAEKQAAIEESKSRAKTALKRRETSRAEAYRTLEDPDATRVEISGAMKELREAYNHLYSEIAQLYFALAARLQVKP